MHWWWQWWCSSPYAISTMNQMIVNLLVLQVLKVLMHCSKDQLNQYWSWYIVLNGKTHQFCLFRSKWYYSLYTIVSDTFRFGSRPQYRWCWRWVSSKRNKLRDWAVSSNIPLVHACPSWNLIRECAKSAKRCKNFVSTNFMDCECDVKEVAGGNYHHFGICNHLKSQLAKNQNLIE